MAFFIWLPPLDNCRINQNQTQNELLALSHHLGSIANNHAGAIV
ncbi:hypothetical protein [Floridanema aerugineum]|uniref:Uncharacterized protein n=1 Tax=Floridaenema aerugineum BLCC-F46 TaxID=3153654 RepID=A0ABV4XCS5_9CYAN